MKKTLAVIGIILLVVLGLYLSYPFVLNGAARFLIVQDKIQKADVIVILGGDNNGERVKEGVSLFKQGYAKHLLMSGGPLAWRLTSAQLMKKQAMESGIPEKAIILEDRSRSTREDAEFCLPIVQKHKFGSVIVVTSSYHTRRSAGVFKKIYSPAGIKVMVYPARKSEFNPDRWWLRHEDAAHVIWEYVSLVLYFLKGY
jgi:uncharacterized SAM-binding protein YcdF (DUF218 family)